MTSFEQKTARGAASSGGGFLAGYKKRTEPRFCSLEHDKDISPPRYGADYEARTRYLHLGKVALYQMS